MISSPEAQLSAPILKPCSLLREPTKKAANCGLFIVRGARCFLKSVAAAAGYRKPIFIGSATSFRAKLGTSLWGRSV